MIIRHIYTCCSTNQVHNKDKVSSWKSGKYSNYRQLVHHWDIHVPMHMSAHPYLSTHAYGQTSLAKRLHLLGTLLLSGAQFSFSWVQSNSPINESVIPHFPPSVQSYWFMTPISCTQNKKRWPVVYWGILNPPGLCPTGCGSVYMYLTKSKSNSNHNDLPWTCRSPKQS